MSNILTIGTFIAYFLAVLFFSKKNKSVADIIIGIWMCVIGTHLLAYHFYQQGLWDSHPYLFGTTSFFPLLHAPFLYLYVNYAIKNAKKFQRKDLIHFLPAALSYPHILKVILFYTPQQKWMLDRGEIDDSLFINTVLTVFLVSCVAYIILSTRKLKKYQATLESELSNTQGVDLRWLQLWIGGISVVFGLVFCIVLLRDFIGIEYLTSRSDYIFYSLFVFLIIVLGYYGIIHKNFSSSQTENESDLKRKTPNASLEEDEISRLRESLQTLMKEQKPYLNPKLTLFELAKSVDTTPNNLSLYLNQYENLSFYNYVNNFRIEEFKQQAQINPKYSILALAYDSGFNSKSSFNNIFKREVGMTPSEYFKLKQIPGK